MSAISLGTKKRGQELRNLATIAISLHQQIKTEGVTFSAESLAGSVASFESMPVDQKANANQVLQKHFVALESMFKEQNIDVTTAQLTAGALVAAAAGNPAEYATAAYKNRTANDDKKVTISAESGGAAGTYGYMDELSPSLESFDNSNLRDFVGLSITYNVQAARQDEFSEAFFRTSVITPDNGGVDITIPNQLVMNHFLHVGGTGPAKFNERRLLDAAINYNILSDQSTALVPEIAPNNENIDIFVPASAVAPKTLDLGNRSVTTAPLKVGVKVDLIAESQYGLIAKNGQADNTDTLDRMTGVKAVYLQVADGDVISFTLNNLPGSYFVKGPEGRGRGQLLNFNNRSLQLSKNTLTVSGAVPTNVTLKEIVDSKLVVYLEFGLTGNIDTDYGNVIVNPAGGVTVYAVYDAQGNKLSLKTGTGLAIVNGLKELAVIGWDPNARLSNANRRERGLQLNTTDYTERYPVPLGPPMSIPSPHAENRDASEMSLLISATRLRNNNNAVTKLLNYADDLDQFVGLNGASSYDEVAIPEIEGIARFLIHPWFRHDDLHLPDRINSITSADRIADVQAVLVNALRDGIFEAYRDSNIQTALDALTGYTGEKYKVLIGTDTVLSRYIITPGDTRTIGDLEYIKVTTQDKRVYGDIYYTFIREGEGIDPLNFGSHIWIPELISNLSVARTGSQYKEAMVQNRSRHVVHLPVLGRIRVTGLSEAVADQTRFPVDTGAAPAAGEDTTSTGTGGTGTDAGTGGSDTGTGTGA